jgi:hypothetical protein
MEGEQNGLENMDANGTAKLLALNLLLMYDRYMTGQL